MGDRIGFYGKMKLVFGRRIWFARVRNALWETDLMSGSWNQFLGHGISFWEPYLVLQSCKYYVASELGFWEMKILFWKMDLFCGRWFCFSFGEMGIWFVGRRFFFLGRRK
jgi:hypothetical protein